MKDYARQAGTLIECVLADTGHAVRYSNARQAGTLIECVLADTGHAVRYSNARQAGTLLECVLADTGHAVGYRYTRQAGTNIECISADTFAYTSFGKIDGSYSGSTKQTCRYFGYVSPDVYRYADCVSGT